MHWSLSLVASSLLCGSLSLVKAATVTYDFNITWVTANPDGVHERPTIGINGQWPLPPITATVGDRVVVNVLNQLGNQSTSLHFHGLFMNGTTHMDGPAGVTQCAIPPGGSFTYDFPITQPGTYWYHSHAHGQYPDGLRGPLIIHDPMFPYEDSYDEELVLTLSDWYHDQLPGLISSFISVTNPTGAEPIPNAALMNDTQNLRIHVQPGKTYMFRIVNMAAFAAQYLWFEGHSFRIIEVDGIYTQQTNAQMLYITPAQRYTVLLTTKNNTSTNFAVVGSMDEELFDKVPTGLKSNVTGWLVYDETQELPAPKLITNYYAFDDFALVPHDRQGIYEDVDYSLTLNFRMGNLGDGANYAFFNDATYVSPKVPTLYTLMSAGEAANNVTIYGSSTNSFVLKKDDVVELILNSDDPGKHPFHLHGHAFQAIARSDPDAGPYDPANATEPSRTPMRRDTFVINPFGHFVLRFKADNPGVWLFHCHIEWHVDSGLIATLIEAPLDIQKTLEIPEDHYQACRDAGIPTAGNAAANTQDLFDLSGENLPPQALPEGFTARGIVALVFSCLTAFVGMAAITWYGVGEIKVKKAPSMPSMPRLASSQ